MGVTTLINDRKQQSTTASISSAYITLGKRRDISSVSLLQNPEHHPVVLPISNPNPPPQAERFKSLNSAFCFRSSLVPLLGPGDGKLAPVSHSCSWVLMPLKV